MSSQVMSFTFGCHWKPQMDIWSRKAGKDDWRSGVGKVAQKIRGDGELDSVRRRVSSDLLSFSFRPIIAIIADFRRLERLTQEPHFDYETALLLAIQ